jgi:hypothetical protein
MQQQDQNSPMANWCCLLLPNSSHYYFMVCQSFKRDHACPLLPSAVLSISRGNICATMLNEFTALSTDTENVFAACFLLLADMLSIPRGTIRATVLIETITAAFEMEEIIYELRQHSSGLNCGRWDYIFSFIKKFRNHPDKVLPNR